MTDPATLVDALNRAHFEVMEADGRVVVMGEDVGVNGGVFRVTEGLLEEFGERRVMDTPLSESGILGTAIGMATFGLKPVAEIQFSGFLYPGMDQIVSHMSRLRTRSRGGLSCPVVIRAPYSGGISAPEHHSESPEALFAHVPGLKVVTPSGPQTARALLHGAVADPDPVLFLEPKRIYRSFRRPLEEDAEPVPPGRARVVREGGELTIVSWGAMLRAVQRLYEEEDDLPDARIVDLQSLSPIDGTTVAESVRKTGRALVVQEAPRSVSLASEVTALINERAFLHLEAPVERVTGFDTVIPLARLEDDYLPGRERILQGIRDVVTF